MDDRKRKWIWFTGIVTILLTIPIIYSLYPPQIDNNIYPIIGMAILMILTSLFYFPVRGTDIIVLQGLTLAAFLIFGLFVEMILTQLAIMSYLIFRRLSLDDLYRFAVNSMMFLFVSVTSAIVFFLMGGKTNVLLSGQSPLVLPIIGYYFMAFFSNHLFLYTFRKMILKKGRFIEKDMLWEAITIALIMPVGVVLYILYSQIGSVSILFISVPMVTISVIFKLVNKSHQINTMLQKSSEIGQQLTEKLDVNHILDLFLERVPTMLEVDYQYIVSFDGQESPKIIQMHAKDKSIVQEEPFTMTNDMSWKVFQTGKSFCCKDKRGLKNLSHEFLPEKVQSVLSVPMVRNNKVVGVITAASYAKRAYEKQQLTVMEILANFMVVAMDNAKDYEKTKQESERCPLTNLYNYRYFMRKLDGMYSQQSDVPFSIIMIDIDHFKRINDRHGHENGNMVLCGIADRLVKIIGENGTVARYGGEEFIVLLPNTDSKQCFEWAEHIRLSISNDPFVIYSEMNKQSHLANITASIGISTAPFHAEEAMDLIRNADRAMYSGAKQQGRNRVSAYVG